MKRDVFEVIVDKEAPKEFCVSLSSHSSRCQHLVFQEQLPYFIGKGSIHTALTIEGACIADSAAIEQVLNQV